MYFHAVKQVRDWIKTKYWSFKVVMGLFVTRSQTQIDYLILAMNAGTQQ